MWDNNYPSTQVAIDTLSNLEPDDTLTIFNDQNWGYALGHNSYGDIAWAEKYTVTGSVSVLGGAYFLYANTIQSGNTNAMGQIYSTGADGPVNQIGNSANIPFSSIPLGGSGATYFAFGTPIAVTNSFYTVFRLPSYTSTQDTIGVITSRNGNRSAGDSTQNAAMWNDNMWYLEETENFGLVVTYCLFPIINFPSGVGSVSKNDLTLYNAYPNPVSSNVTLKYELVSNSDVTIKIMDSQGKILQTIQRTNLTNGTQYEMVDTSNLSSGTYLFSVVSGSATLVSSFTVSK